MSGFRWAGRYVRLTVVAAAGHHVTQKRSWRRKETYNRSFYRAVGFPPISSDSNEVHGLARNDGCVFGWSNNANFIFVLSNFCR